ncbi:MAG: hypothetical protein ACFB00_10080 [Parvularculaceae bacterium]
MLKSFLRDHPMRSHFSAAAVGLGLAMLVIVPTFLGLAAVGRDGAALVSFAKEPNAGEFERRREGQKLSAKWRGEFNVAADGRSLTALDGRFEVTRNSDGMEVRLVLKGDGAPDEAEVFVDGDAQPIGPEREALIGDLIQEALRASGLKAGERVAAMLSESGPDRVLDEIDALAGDHAKRAYIEALAEHKALTPAKLEALAAKVKALESDFERRSAIEALIAHASANERAVSTLIASAREVESDFEKREIIVAAARALVGPDDRLAMNDDLFALFDALESDFEMRFAAEALFRIDGLTTPSIVRVAQTLASRLDSDFETRLAVEAAARFAGRDDEARDALFALVDAIDSDFERRQALEALAPFMSSKDDRAAYERAAANIDSAFERKQALEALGR